MAHHCDVLVDAKLVRDHLLGEHELVDSLLVGHGCWRRVCGVKCGNATRCELGLQTDRTADFQPRKRTPKGRYFLASIKSGFRCSSSARWLVAVLLPACSDSLRCSRPLYQRVCPRLPRARAIHQYDNAVLYPGSRANRLRLGRHRPRRRAPQPVRLVLDCARVPARVDARRHVRRDARRRRAQAAADPDAHVFRSDLCAVVAARHAASAGRTMVLLC
jgi:hypothetical protein